MDFGHNQQSELFYTSTFDYVLRNLLYVEIFLFDVENSCFLCCIYQFLQKYDRSRSLRGLDKKKKSIWYSYMHLPQGMQLSNCQELQSVLHGLKPCRQQFS